MAYFISYCNFLSSNLKAHAESWTYIHVSFNCNCGNSVVKFPILALIAKFLELFKLTFSSTHSNNFSTFGSVTPKDDSPPFYFSTTNLINPINQ